MRRLSQVIIAACFVSIAVLLLGALVEGTPVVLIVIPAVIGALTAVTMPAR